MAPEDEDETDEKMFTGPIGNPYADAQLQLHRLKHGAALGTALRHLAEASREVQKHPEALARTFEQDALTRRIYLATDRRIARETVRDLYGSALVIAQTHISQVALTVATLNEACGTKGLGPLVPHVSRSELRKRSVGVDRIYHFANFWKHRYDDGPLHAATEQAVRAVQVDPQSPDAVERLVHVLSPQGPDFVFQVIRSDVTDWVADLVDSVQTDLESKHGLLLVQHSDTGGQVWGWKKP